MYKNVKQGWYKIQNSSKHLIPGDRFMQSFNEATNSVLYKSGLELKAIRYCDLSPKIKKWSLEPYPIKYRKPTDNRVHRYYVDLYVEYATGARFLIEIKPSTQIVPPRMPKKQTRKSLLTFQRAQVTFGINTAKWDAAAAFAEKFGMTFAFLTEKELG